MVDVQMYLLYMSTHVELCKIGIPSWAYSIMLFICNEELRLGSTSKLSCLKCVDLVGVLVYLIGGKSGFLWRRRQHALSLP